MKVHANAALGPAGRLALVRAIESGMTQKAAAAAFCVAPATAHRWWHRWLEASTAERSSGAWLADRSSRPHRQPRRLSVAEEEPILAARRRTRFGPHRLAGLLRIARSTIWKVLARNGLSRLLRGERQSFKRYEWSEPGALLHIDVKRLARFERPGHAVTGQARAAQPSRRLGLPARRRRRPLPLRARRAAAARGRRDQRRLPRARDRRVRRARHGPSRGGDERQRQGLWVAQSSNP
jgi:transposase